MFTSKYNYVLRYMISFLNIASGLQIMHIERII